MKKHIILVLCFVCSFSMKGQIHYVKDRVVLRVYLKHDSLIAIEINNYSKEDIQVADTSYQEFLYSGLNEGFCYLHVGEYCLSIDPEKRYLVDCHFQRTWISKFALLKKETESIHTIPVHHNLLGKELGVYFAFKRKNRKIERVYLTFIMGKKAF